MGTHELRSRLVPDLSRAAAWLIAAVFILLAARLAQFVDRYSVNLVFWDQWDFLQGLFDGADAWTLFRWQHGPQRQGLGNLLHAALYEATGWNGRADAAASAGAMVLAALGALWLVKRVTGTLRPWDAVVPLLFLTTANVETYAVAPNLAHGPLPAVFLVAYALALTAPAHVLKGALVAVVNFLAVNTGFTLLLGAITPVVLLVFARRPGLSRAEREVYAAGIAVSLATLALFLHGFRAWPAAECFAFPHERPLEYVPFAGLVLARPFGLEAGTEWTRLALGSTVLIGAAGLAAYGAVRALKSEASPMVWDVTAVLVGFAVIFAITTAIGRVCLGINAASASRYIPYVVPGLTAVYLVLRSLRPSRIGSALLCLFLAAGVVKEANVEREQAEAYSSYKRLWRNCYLARHDIRLCDQLAGHAVYPWPESTRLQEKLNWLEARHYNLFEGSPPAQGSR